MTDRKSHPLPDVMLKVGGDDKSFRCDCGCNVFRHPVGEPDVFACNACDHRWTGQQNVTDRERLNAVLQDIPGDATSWSALSERLLVCLPVSAHPEYYEAGTRYGDGTVDHLTLGHVRNMWRAIDALAFAMVAAERGDDPDIPF